jgi:hypothetical protein
MSGKLELFLGWAIGMRSVVATRASVSVTMGGRGGGGGSALLVAIRRIVAWMAGSVIAAVGHALRFRIVARLLHIRAGFKAAWIRFVWLAHDASPFLKNVDIC